MDTKINKILFLKQNYLFILKKEKSRISKIIRKVELELKEIEMSNETVQNDAKKYEATIWKSGYYHGQHLINFFLNYNVSQNPGAFSILVRKGKFNTVYNTTPQEKISFVRAILAQLTPDEIALAMKKE